MWRSKKEVEKRRAEIKELYEKGLDVYEIVEAMGVSISTVYNGLSIAGITLPKAAERDESNLIYADNSIPELEKVIIDGKRYTDVTPIFAPR